MTELLTVACTYLNGKDWKVHTRYKLYKIGAFLYQKMHLKLMFYSVMHLSITFLSPLRMTCILNVLWSFVKFATMNVIIMKYESYYLLRFQDHFLRDHETILNFADILIFADRHIWEYKPLHTSASQLPHSVRDRKKCCRIFFEFCPPGEESFETLTNRLV